MRDWHTYFLFLGLLALGWLMTEACRTTGSCPSTTISAPKVSARQSGDFFSMKRSGPKRFKEQNFFSGTGSRNRKRGRSQKSFLAITSKSRSSNYEGSFFSARPSRHSHSNYEGSFFASSRNKSRRKRETDFFASPQSRKHVSRKKGGNLSIGHTPKKRSRRDIQGGFSRKKTQERYIPNKPEKGLFDDKVLWYKQKKRDPDAPKDPNGKEGGKD